MTAIYFPGIPRSVFRVRAGWERSQEGDIATFLSPASTRIVEDYCIMAMAPTSSSGGSPSAYCQSALRYLGIIYLHRSKFL